MVVYGVMDFVYSIKHFKIVDYISKLLDTSVHINKKAPIP